MNESKEPSLSNSSAPMPSHTVTVNVNLNWDIIGDSNNYNIILAIQRLWDAFFLKSVKLFFSVLEGLSRLDTFEKLDNFLKASGC